ncbi:hypothetical protein TNIN_250651 [Trichonephila inaurata madagascariensis]|uniref:Uncharacterized protein n=1 Tax=Trichonephila inaurata madagascariensis TaxID=2747483 RepID=A0A8X6IUE0_9ARAC|nr:hypothetical protein TNIN_250651 [Trichonephila inaurata madagascariensis]
MIENRKLIVQLLLVGVFVGEIIVAMAENTKDTRGFFSGSWGNWRAFQRCGYSGGWATFTCDSLAPGGVLTGVERDREFSDSVLKAIALETMGTRCPRPDCLRIYTGIYRDGSADQENADVAEKLMGCTKVIDLKEYSDMLAPCGGGMEGMEMEEMATFWCTTPFEELEKVHYVQVDPYSDSS